MALAVFSSLLPKVGELAIDEAKSLLGFKENVEDAMRELGLTRYLLKDADARARAGNGDETLAHLVVETADAAYDLDDVVSTFVLKQEIAEEAEATNGVFDMVVGVIETPIELHKVGSKIDKNFKRLSKLNQSLLSYGVSRNNNVVSSKQRLNDLRRTYDHVREEDDFVENSGGMMELATQLTKKGNLGSPFASIYGMGGLGKTTLAKMVYHYKEVREHFKCFAWVFVGQQFQPKDIWKRVLIDLVSDPDEKKEIRKMEQGQLAEKLYDVLKQQKCLAVLDDVWNKADWDLLKAGFPEKTTGSKILITTRRRDVGEHAGRRGFLYQPQCLDDTASWELFTKKAYFQEDATSRGAYEDMEKLGKDMVKDCGGLPLAIVVLGGLLSTKHTVDEWDAVKQNVKELINKGQSIAEEEYNTVFAVLGLSYDELPYDLKLCFLHLANFPEDYEINVKELCRLWTAEGFVPAEDEARKCLMALVDRGMVQVGQWSSIVGRIKTFRIHDLMRDLCLEKAKMENFLRHINFQVPGDPLPTSNVRRLAIQLNDDIVDGLPRMTNIRESCLRSLLCIASKVEDSNDLMKPLFNRFDMLKVFKFEFISRSGVEVPDLRIPEEIGKLIHLRLLSLKDFGNLFALPSSMVNLRRLQTLDLRARYRCQIDLRSMSVVSKLYHLKHLYLPHVDLSTGLDEDGHWLRLGNLTSLETLVNFDTDFCVLDDLSQLTKLTKLGIHLSKNTLQTLGEINLPSNLHSLSVSSKDYSSALGPFLSSYPQIQKLRLNGRFVNSLENIVQFFSNVVKLTLRFAYKKDDPMPILAKLSKLRSLALVKGAYVGKIMVCCKDSFPQLESLSLDGLWGLEEWRVEEGALSKLCRLEIYNCMSLKSYPDGLRNITTLKEIKPTFMGKYIMRSFDQKGEDEASTSRTGLEV